MGVGSSLLTADTKWNSWQVTGPVEPGSAPGPCCVTAQTAGVSPGTLSGCTLPTLSIPDTQGCLLALVQ